MGSRRQLGSATKIRELNPNMFTDAVDKPVCRLIRKPPVPTGDFSFVASPGLKIKNGEIIGSVQGAMVSGNVLHLLSNLQIIGNDYTDFGCSIMPSMTFRDVKITTG